MSYISTILKVTLHSLLLTAVLFFFDTTVAMTQMEDEGVFELQLKEGTMHISFVNSDILHVTISPDGNFEREPSLSVKNLETINNVKKTTEGDSVFLSTQLLRVAIHKKSGDITVRDNDGEKIVKAEGPETGDFKRNIVDKDSAWSVKQHFNIEAEEGLFGLGQFQEGWMNFRNKEILLTHSNTRAAIPFMISSKGYGILWDNYSRSYFSDNSEQTTLSAEVADVVDYYIVAGEDPEEAIAGYRELTGKAPMYPKWAYGFWQSRERYVDQEDILDVASEFREREIPIDVIVQDWNYWPDEEHFSGLVWDSTRYPDPTKMVSQLNDDLNMRLLVSLWPAVGIESEVHEELEEEGYLFPGDHWSPAHVYDVFSPEARDIYWKHAQKGLYDKGVDAWWLDGTEPEFRSTDDRYITETSFKANGKSAIGSIDRYLNAFSLQHSKGMYENLSNVSDSRPVILTRSAFAGQQRYATTFWSGDIYASWKVFEDQIASGLNVSMAGFPYWTTDIGAFVVNHRFPEGNEDPAYRELYTRWYQFGAFSPIFRSHGTDTEREIWYFGEEGSWAYDAIAKADRLRYRLLPYIYTQAWNVYEHDGSFMRALPMAYPEDKETYSVNNSYMFGNELLVSPVTKAMSEPPSKIRRFITTKDLYLPDSSQHALRREVYSGIGFDTLKTEELVENIRMTWQGSLPSEVIDMPYSLRYTGRIGVNKSGVHEFIFTVKGGARLWIDGEMVIDAWEGSDEVKESEESNQAMAEAWKKDETKEYRGKIELTKGEKPDIKIEYRQPQPNAANLILEWKEPGLREEIVSDSNMWPTYLPKGEVWHNFWTGNKVQGGQVHKMEAPIHRVPLYVKAGSILPMGPEIEYTGQKPADPIEIRVYEGQDASYTLYEDQGDGQGYKGDQYALIPFKWDNSKQVLTIEQRGGAFPDMLKERTFNIYKVSEDHGTGLISGDEPDTSVTYNGDRVEVLLD